MNASDTQPKGRPIQEIRAIVTADQDLFDRFAEAWQYLREQTKHNLVTIAESEAADEYDKERANT